ncbi:MAG: hypothetical protein JWO89_3386, partial [Verrucomicrobiaceae bacterium]|nr:hypothetical protein [Verrucomicrobiaceae bacterium]
KVLAGWREWKEQGKTEHRNWWPELYLAFCQQQHLQPDPKAMAFNTSYEAKRADLERLPASA